MGTNEKLVPGELLGDVPGLNYWAQKIFKINIQTNLTGLDNNTNEEIAHV